MTDAELYDKLNNTHDVRWMIGCEIYSRQDFEREHNAICEAWRNV